MMDRKSLSNLIAEKLATSASGLQSMWAQTGGSYCFIDDLLDDDLAKDIFNRFPTSEYMMTKKSLREFKYVAAQMNLYDPTLEEIVFAFQEPNVLGCVEDIVNIPDLLGDKRLYAGGISMMSRNQFLNPHLDNSHDADRINYRVLNLLYYVTPEWIPADGGNLELWPNGVTGKPLEIHSKFNRLVLMATNQKSWHSVSKVNSEGRRCCVSNYYFSEKSPENSNYFHVTSFRGRPEQPLRDILLRSDAFFRSSLRKIFPQGIVKTKHIYK